MLPPPRSARGQALADRVPGDAVVYLGWAGCEQAGEAYAASHLKAVLDASDVQATLQQLLPQALAGISADDPKSAEQARAWLGVFGAMRKHPTALFLRVAPLNGDSARHSPRLRFAILCRAGSESSQLLRSAQSALDLGPCPLVDRAEQAGDLLVLSSGYGAGEDVLPGQRDVTLPATQPFREALRQTLADPLASAYVDVERALDLLGERFAGPAGARQGSGDTWKKIREASGLDAASTWISGGRFEGKDWTVQSFLRTLGQRKGALAALLDSRPVDPALLARVPRESSYALQSTLDAARLLSEIRRAAADTDSRAAHTLDQALGAAQMAIGRNLQTEILEPLGDQWVLYTAPGAGIGANNVQGLVLVNKPRDRVKANKGLVSLTFAASNLSRSFLQQRGVTAVLKQQKLPPLDPNAGGSEATLYWLEITQAPQLSPGWVMQDGFLYLGATKEAVIAAAKFRGSGKSIADADEFQRLKSLLKVPNEIGGFEFADLNQTVDDVYRQIDQHRDALLKAVRDQGVNLDKLPVPPLDKLKEHLSGYLRVSWTDEAGYHSRRIEPFPLSGVLAPQKVGGNTVAGIGGVAMAVAAPSLLQARETANRISCASHMRQIGTACLLYASENNGKFPPDVATVLRTQDITWGEFVCPNTGTSLPPALKTPDEVIGWIAGHTDYVYVGQSLTSTSPANKLVLYEDMKHHGDGCNMLFADGHVEFVLREKAQNWIAAGERPADEPLPGGP
jgi:prepilin-type processing-associated H-X9-DG protein